MNQGDGGLRRELGLFDAVCVVVGAIIGVGIFFTPSKVAALAGSQGAALLTWAAGGGIALLGALTFAELGSLCERSGGQYEILRDAYGPLPAFLYVFCNATAIQAGSAAVIALVTAQYLGKAVTGAVPGEEVLTLLSLMLILGLVLANTAGVRWGARVQNFTVLAKTATLGLLVLAALLFGGGPHREAGPGAGISPPASLLGGLFAGLVPAFFSYGGWQHALWIGGEIRDPRKNVPRAILLGVLLVVLVYLSAGWAYFHLLGFQGTAQSASLASDAVGVLWPGAGERVTAAAVALSAFGVLNAQFLSGPRLLFGMARDGRFFGFFGKVSPRFRTPWAAIWLIGASAAVLLVAAGENRVYRILTGVVFIDGCFFVLTGLALPVLRRKRPSAPRSFRVPLYPAVPLLFAAGETCVLVGAYLDSSTRRAAVIGAAWIGAALLAWWLFPRFRTGNK